MILAAHQARAVLAGRKTQIRVPIVESRRTRRANGTVYDTVPYKPAIEERIPVRVREMVDGERRVVEKCGVIVTGFQHQLLADVDETAARAEGHRTLNDYRDWWVRLREARWAGFSDQLLSNMAATEAKLAHDLDIGVAFVRRRLHLLFEAEAATIDDGVWDRQVNGELVAEQLATLHRFGQRHADTAVWAIEFRLDTAQAPRVLAGPDRGDARGYRTVDAGPRGRSRPPRPNQTTEPFVPRKLSDEPEAVDDGWLKRFATEAETGGMIRRGQVEQEMLDERRDLGQRLMNARALARERGVDINSEERLIVRKIEQLEQKIRNQHPAAA